MATTPTNTTTSAEVILSRQYYYKNQHGDTIIIQEHQDGHVFKSGVGNQGPHFNVRPISNPRTGYIEGVLDHYEYNRR